MFRRCTVRLRRPIQDERGQAMLEYALIISLVAILTLVVLAALGGALSDQLDTDWSPVSLYAIAATLQDPERHSFDAGVYRQVKVTV